jgi:hypothetical protein
MESSPARLRNVTPASCRIHLTAAPLNALVATIVALEFVLPTRIFWNPLVLLSTAPVLLQDGRRTLHAQFARALHLVDVGKEIVIRTLPDAVLNAIFRWIIGLVALTMHVAELVP